MKIAILSRNRHLYSTQRLIQASQARGHEVHVIDVLKCYMDINSRESGIYYHGQQLTGFDAVIPRIGASVTFYGTAVLRQLEIMGVYAVNDSIAITRARDKLRALQVLARSGIGMPLTGFAHSVDDTEALIKLVNGAPLVVKLLEGSQGKGVVLAETHQAAESLIDAFRNLSANFLVQEFIAEAGGCDIRCLVIGNQVVAAMQRNAKPGDFRSNLHRGGTARLVELTAEERAMALQASREMGLNVSGVDILRSHRGPLVLEVNSSPGLEGIEGASGLDIAGMILEWTERHSRPNEERVRGIC